MADENEEVEGTEDEEEEEEEEKPRKKKGRGKAAFKERGPRSNKNLREHGTLGGSNLYPRAVPIDDRGIAEEDIELDQNTIRRIGSFDAESARTTEQSRRVLQRKARGEAGVRWNAEASVRYWEVKQMHPSARVSVKQVLPVNDESIPAVNFQICKSYDDLKQYVRAKHWRGNHAIYEWKIYDDMHSSLAVGKFEFAENPDFDSQLPQQTQQQPQAQTQPQYPGWPPGYGAPPGYPPPGYGPPPYPGYPPQPQQQPPPAPPQPQAGGSELAQVLAQNNYLISVLVAEKQGHAPPLPPEYYAWLANKDKPAPPPAEPAAPVNPLHEVERAVNMVDAVAAVGRKLENRFGGGGGQQQNNDPPPPGEDDNFPIQVRKIGPANVGSKDGELLPMGAQIALNAGTIVEMFDGFLKKGKETAREIAESRQQTLRLEAERERERLRALERAAQINREMQQPLPPPPPQHQNPATAMPWSQPWEPVVPEPSVAVDPVPEVDENGANAEPS